MKPMETMQDLIDEAKVRAVWWCLCIFGISYFLSHTSKSMWTNIPVSVLILLALRYLSYEVDLHWRTRPVPRQTPLSSLPNKHLTLDDPHLSSSLPIKRWSRKIESPLVEAAVLDFTDKIIQDFVVDLWYTSISPDKDAPELIRALILDAIGEISGRIKEINLVDLLTRDIVELIGSHLDLFRKNQSRIGVEVMGTLSSEERDERLKHHLMASKELHPALMSPESEYKVLQRLVEGILAVVLDPRETPLVRCLSRELLTCLVMEPVMNLASPGYINELIELVFLDAKDDKSKEGSTIGASNKEAIQNGSKFLSNSQNSQHGPRLSSASSSSVDLSSASMSPEVLPVVQTSMVHEDSAHTINPKPADWARKLDAVTQRRTQVLAPDNLDNMWTKGRNYQKKAAKLAKDTVAPGTSKGVLENYVQSGLGNETATSSARAFSSEFSAAYDLNGIQPTKGSTRRWDDGSGPHRNTKTQLKHSSSTSDLREENSVHTPFGNTFSGAIGVSEICNPVAKGTSDSIIISEGSSKTLKIKCRVVGAYFEKAGSNPFAVYSIAVTVAENKTSIVKRRYKNFERLHRLLKDIPNYNLHLPPKRFLSSSIEDSFVFQRCIQLDKYLQDLLSIANIAEQHEVLDFLSTNSKNYSFGKATSVMKTLAVNMDDAMDDIFRQFKGVSGGLRRKVSGLSPSSSDSTIVPVSESTKSSASSVWNEDDKSTNYDNQEIPHSLSDGEVPDEGASASISGWHSDNELTAGFERRVPKHRDGFQSLDLQKSYQPGKNDRVSLDKDHSLSASSISESTTADPVGIPPEWSPPNVGVPVLNLVDKIFQLNQRGWIRRQVFWISKQILQLMMEDAIDDWLVRQINWLRKDDVIALGIRWVQDVLWPNGTFFIKLDSNKVSSNDDGCQVNQKSVEGKSRGPRGAKSLSFEQQLEASRRESDVKKLILGGAPTTLTSLIGPKQYKRCAQDIYYFLQSTVCIKQLAYGMLEVLLLSLFPELQELILDIHQSKQPSYLKIHEHDL